MRVTKIIFQKVMSEARRITKIDVGQHTNQSLIKGLK